VESWPNGSRRVARLSDVKERARTPPADAVSGVRLPHSPCLNSASRPALPAVPSTFRGSGADGWMDAWPDGTQPALCRSS